MNENVVRIVLNKMDEETLTGAPFRSYAGAEGSRGLIGIAHRFCGANLFDLSMIEPNHALSQRVMIKIVFDYLF